MLVGALRKDRVALGRVGLGLRVCGLLGLLHGDLLARVRRAALQGALLDALHQRLLERAAAHPTAVLCAAQARGLLPDALAAAAAARLVLLRLPLQGGAVLERLLRAERREQRRVVHGGGVLVAAVLGAAVGGAEPEVPADVDEGGAARHAHGRPFVGRVRLQRREQLHAAVLQRRLRLELLAPPLVALAREQRELRVGDVLDLEPARRPQVRAALDAVGARVRRLGGVGGVGGRQSAHVVLPQVPQRALEAVPRPHLPLVVRLPRFQVGQLVERRRAPRRRVLAQLRQRGRVVHVLLRVGGRERAHLVLAHAEELRERAVLVRERQLRQQLLGARLAALLAPQREHEARRLLLLAVLAEQRHADLGAPQLLDVDALLAPLAQVARDPRARLLRRLAAAVVDRREHPAHQRRGGVAAVAPRVEDRQRHPALRVRPHLHRRLRELRRQLLRGVDRQQLRARAPREQLGLDGHRREGAVGGGARRREPRHDAAAVARLQRRQHAQRPLGEQKGVARRLETRHPPLGRLAPRRRQRARLGRARLLGRRLGADEGRRAASQAQQLRLRPGREEPRRPRRLARVERRRRGGVAAVVFGDALRCVR